MTKHTTKIIFLPPYSKSTRICTRCFGEFPNTSEYFSYRADRNQVNARCKKCVCEITQLYMDKLSPEQRQQKLKYQREYERKHRDDARRRSRIFEHKHREEIREKKKKEPNHNQKRRIQYERRRAKQKSLLATFTHDDWIKALAYFGECCAVCGRPQGFWHKIVADHWIPLTMGGAYVPKNIIPLCHGLEGCNNSKSNKNPIEWIHSKYSNKQAKIILARINGYFASLSMSPSDAKDRIP